MIKKMLSVLLALMLCMVATVAIAENPDSPSGNYVEVEQVVSTGTVAAPADFGKAAAAASEECKQAEEALVAYAAAGGSVIAFFNADTTAVAAVLPEGVDAANLELAEMAQLDTINYDPAYGDVSVTVKLSTAMDPTKAAVVMVSYVDATGAVQWMPVAAVANADGTLTINYTASELIVLNGQAPMIAVLQA